MSSYSKVNKVSSNISKSSSRSSKPFCKVCYDAGKPEREYTSHYVKSKPGDEGKVVCPYLLSIVCSYCKKKAGHTARHCPVLLEKEDKKKEEDHTANNKKSSSEDAGWTNASRQANVSRTASVYAPDVPKRSRLADTPPPAPEPTKEKKVNTWAMIASGKPVVTAAAPLYVPTPSPTPEALLAIQPDISSEYSEEEESDNEESDNEDVSYSPAAPFRYVYGVGCWADEE